MLALAYAAGLIPGAASHTILASVIISMVLAPPLLRHGPALHARLFPGRQRDQRARAAQALNNAAAELSEHVILCGYGRVGRNTAALLERAHIPWLALDLDLHRTRTAFEAGKPVYYGDATHPEVLTAAGIHKARALVIGLDDAPGTLKCLAAARRVHARIPILARSRDERHLEELYAAGAGVVVPETLESGLALASALLTHLERPQDEIEALLTEVRAAHYRPLRE
jgi:CPA2 family monovalent cation:H+ antiporter-2